MRKTKMLNWEDKIWIRNYLNNPRVAKLFKRWEKSDFDSIKMAIRLRKLISLCENSEKINNDKDKVRSLMLEMHETGQEVNTNEIQEAIKLFNHVVELIN
jgi:hypothetical protein